MNLAFAATHVNLANRTYKEAAMELEAKVLIVDEPTRGVDIGAKSQIHNYLRKLVNDGVGVIVISSEQPEILGLCDRILVVAEGCITKDFNNRQNQVTQEEIMKYSVLKESIDG